MRRIASIVILFISIPVAPLLSAEPPVTRLWPKRAPGETGKVGAEKVLPDRPGARTVQRVTNVSVPTATLFRPAKGKANGCGVVICPGGGYSILAWDLEGTEVAKWLNSLGVTAVLLKYRVPRRDKLAPHKAPLQDVQRAIRLTRRNAKSWGIDPQRLGVLGFSAGGHLTVMAGTHWDESTYPKVDSADDLSCRPDFLIPIYPAYLTDKSDRSKLSPLVRVTKETPPTFVAVAADDHTFATDSALLFIALKKAGVKAEVHIFTHGGHGFGLRPTKYPVTGWPKLCGDWMRMMGFLSAGKAAARAGR
jgi:acetyl esterase/lipase